MDNLTFRSAFIRFADLRIKDEAGVFCRLHLTAELTEPVSEAMDWDEFPDCVDSAKLEGLLSGQSLVLTPNQKELRQHEVQLECSEVSDFQIFRVTGSDGESKRTELRFIARIIAPGAVAQIENYLRLVGTAEGALKVSYVSQSQLPLTELPQEARISDESEPPEAEASAAPLANAATMGGTHQKRGRPPRAS